MTKAWIIFIIGIKNQMGEEMKLKDQAFEVRNAETLNGKSSA